MALSRNTGLGQTDNATVSIANSDDFGESQFHLVTIGAGGTLTYDNEKTLPGQSMAFKVVPAASQSAIVQYGGSTGNLGANDLAVDAWFYRTANPTAEHTIINGTTAAGGRRLNINIDGAGKIRVRAEGSTYLSTFTNAIPLNAWFRVRVYSRNQGVGASTLKVALVNAANTVIEEYSTTTADRTEAIAAVAFGKAGTDASATAFWMGDLQVESAATGYLDIPLATPVVTVSTFTNPTLPGATDGSGTVTWSAITDASFYVAEIAPGLNATTGFVVKSSGATSPYTFTGLGGGNYTLSITAHPAA